MISQRLLFYCPLFSWNVHYNHILSSVRCTNWSLKSTITNERVLFGQLSRNNRNPGLSQYLELKILLLSQSSSMAHLTEVSPREILIIICFWASVTKIYSQPPCRKGIGPDGSVYAGLSSLRLYKQKCPHHKSLLTLFVYTWTIELKWTGQILLPYRKLIQISNLCNWTSTFTLACLC